MRNPSRCRIHAVVSKRSSALAVQALILLSSCVSVSSLLCQAAREANIKYLPRAWRASIARLRYAFCPPEPALVSGDASLEWIRSSEWEWNGWRTVVFRDDFKFDAPTADCEAGRCSWHVDASGIVVEWGEAGPHLMKPSANRRVLSGTRIKDSSHCTARFLRSLPQNPYRILGVERNATQKEVRQAHRRLSLEHHPDKGAMSAAKFNAVQTAYETLSDPDKRSMYDSFGSKRFTTREEWLTAVKHGQVSRSSGFYADDGSVTKLTASTFDRFTTQNKPVMIEFYTPWCSHCQDLAPEYRRFGAMMDGIAAIGAVNCEDQESVCRRVFMYSYPTIILYRRGRSDEYYNGPHTADGLRSFLRSRSPHSFDSAEEL